jgi:DNA-binding response OmpR family regulator
VNDGDAPILLVEDEAELGLVLKEIIEEWDYGVLLVPSGGEAMPLLAEQPVGLVLLDCSSRTRRHRSCLTDFAPRIGRFHQWS